MGRDVTYDAGMATGFIFAVAGALLLGSAAPAAGHGVQDSDGSSVPVEERDPFQRGRDLEEVGAWERALDVWREARHELSAEDIYDPRIGIAFIDVATENAAEEYYEEASEIFIWGFSGTELAPYREAVLNEVRRLLPIVEDEDSVRWAELVEDPDPDLLREVKKFWIQKDPTPTTPTNERLVEHWERIQYARRNFRYSNYSPYGTDDRGTVYVKYGPPGRTKSGMLGASEMELKIRVPNDAEARAAMRRYDPNPQYEVWKYDSLNPQDFTYFLFGNEDGRGRFKLVDGVNDLIAPEAKARASANANPGGVPMEHYLELFYYQDLSPMGGRFGRRFSELDMLWNYHTNTRQRSYVSAGRQAPTEGTLEAMSFKFQMRDRHEPETPPAFPVLSDFEGKARDQLIVQAVRILSDSNEPRLVIMALSSPRLKVSFRDALENEDRIDVPGYFMRHTLIVRDEKLSEVGRLHQRVSSRRGDVSTFTLRQPDLPLHLTVTAETVREGQVVGEAQGPPFPGQAHLEPEPPLSTDTSAFQMSDLATGVDIPEGVDRTGLPFPLVPTRKIWRRDALKVYLELYHLGVDREDAARFRARFSVLPLESDGSPDRSREPVTLSVDLQSEGRTYRQAFEIALHDQPVGNYRLTVEVTDLTTGKTRTRTAPIEIIG